MATRPSSASSNGKNGTSRGVARRAQTAATAATPARIAVRKTYKLFVGGDFPRSESGRSYLVSAADGSPLANAARASRKDLRDAVRVARKAFSGWAGNDAVPRTSSGPNPGSQTMARSARVRRRPKGHTSR